MNERERLIEMLNQAHQEYYAKLEVGKTYMEALADHLLANGVTVDKDTNVPTNLKSQNKTNADRIRAMTDEELGIFLGEWAENPLSWKQDGTGECLRWLQEPPKEEK